MLGFINLINGSSKISKIHGSMLNYFLYAFKVQMLTTFINILKLFKLFFSWKFIIHKTPLVANIRHFDRKFPTNFLTLSENKVYWISTLIFYESLNLKFLR